MGVVKVTRSLDPKLLPGLVAHGQARSMQRRPSPSAPPETLKGRRSSFVRFRGNEAVLRLAGAAETDATTLDKSCRTTLLKVACMYCRAPLGIKDGLGTEGTSHGICEICWKARLPGHPYPGPSFLERLTESAEVVLRLRDQSEFIMREARILHPIEIQGAG